MADTNSSTSSWPGFLAQINTTFNLVRDAFGYALPGAVFLAIGLIGGSYSLCQLQCLLSPYKLPAWAAFIAVIAASYAVGNVMAATVYMPFGVAKYVVWMIDRHWGCRDVINNTDNAAMIEPAVTIAANETKRVRASQTRNLPQGITVTANWFGRRRVYRKITNATNEQKTIVPALMVAPHQTLRVTARQARRLPQGVAVVPLTENSWPEGSWRDWLITNPTEVTAKTLQIRFQYRDLLNTLDRRETLNVMGGSMAAALLSGYFVFCRWHWDFSKIILWGGLIALIQFVTGMSHLRRVLKAVLLANVTPPPPDPNFPQLLSQLLTALTDRLAHGAPAPGP